MCKQTHDILLSGKKRFNAVKFQLLAKCAYAHKKRFSQEAVQM